MDEYEEQLRRLVAKGAGDSKQVTVAVKNVFLDAPWVYELAAQHVPPHLQELCGALVVTAEMDLADSLQRYLIHGVQEAAGETSPRARNVMAVAAAIDAFAAGNLDIADLAGVVIVRRSRRKVLDEAFGSRRKLDIQRVNAEGDRESFEDASDRKMRERGEASPADGFACVLAAQRAGTLRDAVVRIDDHAQRVVLALRRDLFGVSDAMRLSAPFVPAARATDDGFAKYLLAVLEIDAVLAARISFKYRREGAAIRQRAHASNQVRASEFVIANADIAWMLDCSPGRVTQLEAKALEALKEILRSDQEDVA
jgi:hypothetical protein